MPLRVIGGPPADNYPSRLEAIERLVRFIAWMLVVPGIYDLIARRRLDRRARAIEDTARRESP